MAQYRTLGACLCVSLCVLALLTLPCPHARRPPCTDKWLCMVAAALTLVLCVLSVVQLSTCARSSSHNRPSTIASPKSWTTSLVWMSVCDPTAALRLKCCVSFVAVSVSVDAEPDDVGMCFAVVVVLSLLEGAESFRRDVVVVGMMGCVTEGGKFPSVTLVSSLVCAGHPSFLC